MLKSYHEQTGGMNKPTPPKPHNFDKRLAKASELIGAPPDELASIKIRPIVEVGSFDGMYPSDYDGINEAFTEFRDVADVPHEYGWGARVCRFDKNCRCLYIQHESGPEIIIHLVVMGSAAAYTSLLALNQAIKLINNVAKLVRQKPKRGKDGRFIAVSIEKRTAKGIKVIRQIGRIAKTTERAVKSVEELFK
jgi:hypothetical protein